MNAKEKKDLFFIVSCCFVCMFTKIQVESNEWKWMTTHHSQCLSQLSLNDFVSCVCVYGMLPFVTAKRMTEKEENKKKMEKREREMEN